MKLRAPEPSDLDTLYLWENDPETWRVSFNDGPLSRHQLWQYLDSYSPDIATQGQIRLIIEHEGRPAGTIDLTDYSARHRRAQVGLYIAPAFRRLGLAGEAMKMICTYARDITGMHQLYAMTAVDNAAASALLQLAGFATCGRLRSYLRLKSGSYTDVLIFQKILI